MAKLKRDEFDVMVPPQSGGGGNPPPGEKVKDVGTIDPPPPNDDDKNPSDDKGDDKKPSDDKGEDKGGGKGEDKGEDKKPGDEGEGSGKGEGGDSKPGEGKGGSSNVEIITSGIGGLLTDEQSRQMQKDLGVPYENNALDKEEIKAKINRALVENTIPDAIAGSKSQGGGVGGLRNALAKIARPQVDWRKALKKFIGRSTRETEEKLGHRNFIHSGDYIWTERDKEQGAVKDAICAVDVSGSMSDENVAIILTEIKGMVEAKKVKNTRIVYFHSDVELIVDLKGPGAVKKYEGHKVRSGGTEFEPPLKVMQDAYKKDKLEIALFLTDGYANLDIPKPKFVTKFIWVILDNPGFVAPWGNMVVFINSNKGKV